MAHSLPEVLKAIESTSLGQEISDGKGNQFPEKGREQPAPAYWKTVKKTQGWLVVFCPGDDQMWLMCETHHSQHPSSSINPDLIDLASVGRRAIFFPHKSVSSSPGAHTLGSRPVTFGWKFSLKPAYTFLSGILPEGPELILRSKHRKQVQWNCKIQGCHFYPERWWMTKVRPKSVGI